MLIKKYGDVIVSIFFMVLSAALIILARMLPKSAVMDIGPEFMPLCVGVLTFILAAALLIISLKNFKANAEEVAASKLEKVDYKSVLVSFILILVYVYILQPVGFIVSTILYLPIQMMILAPASDKNVKGAIKLSIVAILFTFVVFFLFRYGFKIVLPAGIFTINL